MIYWAREPDSYDQEEGTVKEKNYLVVCRHHWSCYLFRGLVTVVLLFLGFGILTVVDSMEDFIIVLLFIVPAIIIILVSLVDYKTDYLAITPYEIVRHAGLLYVKSKSTPIDKVQDVSIKYDFLDRIFKCYDLKIDNAGTENMTYVFNRTRNANEFVAAYREILAQKAMSD